MRSLVPCAPGGSQLSSAGGSGAWELPFVGGWDVLYEAPIGSGGIPLRTRADLTLISSRLYVWGPAEGGVSTERVLITRSAGDAAAPAVDHSRHGCIDGGVGGIAGASRSQDAIGAHGGREVEAYLGTREISDAPSAHPSTGGAVVLVRTGSVTNLPGAEVRLDLSAPMSAYRVSSAPAAPAAPLDSATFTLGGVAPLNELILQSSLQPNLDAGESVRRTTFLSERLWAAQLRSKCPARSSPCAHPAL